jgi:hypothetical protein
MLENLVRKKKNLGKFFRSSACAPLLTRLYF